MNVEKIKILIVEPTLDPYVKEIENTLEKKQKIVGGLIEFVELEDDIDLICNEKGKIYNLPMNRIIKNDIICGTFIITGQHKGDTISLSRKQIKKYKKIFRLKNDDGIIKFCRQQIKNSSELLNLNLLGVEKLKGFIVLDRDVPKEYR